MEQHVKLINGVYDSTITVDTQIELAVDGEVFVKWMSNATTAEKASAGYYVLSTLAAGPFDYLTHKAVRQSDASGTLNGDVWQVGFDIVATTAQEQAAIKAAKKEEIKAAMRSEAAVGIVNTSLGFPVDCRRDGFNNDLQNIGAMIRRGVGVIRDANNVERNVTPSQLATIQDEMDLYGLGLYQKKWTLETQIEAATTGAELDAIIF